MSDTERRSEPMDELVHLRAKVAAVEALHFARGRNIRGEVVCNECSPLQAMPCATLRALAAAGDGTPTEPTPLAERCRSGCSPGYRYGDDGCCHTPPSSGAADEEAKASSSQRHSAAEWSDRLMQGAAQAAKRLEKRAAEILELPEWKP